MTSYGPNARVVVAGIDYTEVHDEGIDTDTMKKATPGNTREMCIRDRSFSIHPERMGPVNRIQVK